MLTAWRRGGGRASRWRSCNLGRLVSTLRLLMLAAEVLSSTRLSTWPGVLASFEEGEREFDEFLYE